ncbi:phosphatidate cytidylyltransferase [Ramlibacter rhizophilus]|uniref:Phosphatidate cytidylyltransferase n=1 Tax=Ramlibacter rhizophilus TaxID=1781167 RepID=A0A4Z0BSA7_9BURK|nr:phosphatidate cytidylyltransferase [Ramlibacter rhizophilus]TFZ01612.1 phosphatidate cytidylyltransferase [Ramlibacter rhizophilus]
MLKQRVITAVVLLAILLPALFWPAPGPLQLVLLVLVAAGAWEWGRLNGLSQPASIGLGLACLLLCSLAWWAGWPQGVPPGLWLGAGLVWVLGGAFLLQRGVAGWPRLPRALRVAGGLVALSLAWLAAAQARELGINFLLSVLVLVWVADIAAYAAGKTFGLKFTRSRLAPAISPGKSWEGVWGGMLGVLLLALAWVLIDASGRGATSSLYSVLADRSWVLLVLGSLFLAAMSVVGDLVESLVKRSAGAKDSSGLLPGHGGVLDRIDALLPTLPLAMMLATLSY